MSVSDVAALNKQFYDLIQSKNFSNPRFKQIIKAQKIAIYTVPNMKSQSQDFLAAARDFAEYNVFYALATKDIVEFNRAIDKLKFFYDNFKSSSNSSNYFQLIAITLLHLLSFNKIEDFYTKLEGLSDQEIQNPLIKYVITLNESIEDGSYRKVFVLKDTCPIPFCEMFLDRIEETLRVELAKSSEKAYSSLTTEQALQLFRLKNENDLREFSKKINERSDKISWNIRGGRVHFDPLKVKKEMINSEELMIKMLNYADDIEKIV